MEGNLPLVLGGMFTGWLISSGLMWKDRRLGLAAAATMGLLVSSYLGWQHLDSAVGSICSINETFDCDKVNRSVYSEIFGVPVAFLGSGFYAAVLAVSALGLSKPQGFGRAGSLVLVGGILSVGYSLFLAWASVQLGAWCLLCISLYGVNLLILVGGWLSRHPDGLTAAFGDREDRSLSTMLTAGLVVFVASMAWYNMQKGGAVADVADATAGGASNDAYAQLMELPHGPLTLDGTEPVLGDPNAPYTVVEFADYQCPACATVTPMMHELVARNPNIKVLFKHYPLSSICNSSMDREFHKDSCRAAGAAECARQQGRFWDLTHLMMKNQSDLDPEGLSFMASQVGLDAAAFSTCMADPALMDSVRVDVAAGEQVGVEGTPTVLLQGTHGDQWLMMTAGPEGAEMLVRAHAEGTALPAVPPAGTNHKH